MPQDSARWNWSVTLEVEGKVVEKEQVHDICKRQDTQTIVVMQPLANRQIKRATGV